MRWGTVYRLAKALRAAWLEIQADKQTAAEQNWQRTLGAIRLEVSKELDRRLGPGPPPTPDETVNQDDDMRPENIPGYG